MSGDITTRKKKKSVGRKKEDVILLEPKNPPIIKTKKPQMTVEDLPAPKERNMFSKLCYAFIIFVLLTSSVCGVYMFLLNSDSNVIPSAFSEVQESIAERLKDLSSLKLPEFELGAEYLMPTFLGTTLSVDSLTEMSTKGTEIIVNTFVTASVQLSDALSTVSKSVNPVVSCAKDHVENCLATVSKFIEDTIAAVSTSGISITEEVDDDVPATEQEEDNLADVLNKMTEEINKVQDNIQPDVVAEIQEVNVDNTIDALIDVAEEAHVEASEISQSNDVIVEALDPLTVKATERTPVKNEIDENIRHNIVL